MCDKKEKLYSNEVRINRASDVRRILTRVINGLLVHDNIDEGKARAVIQGATAILKVFEFEDKAKANETNEIKQDRSFIDALKEGTKELWRDEKIEEIDCED